MQPASKLWKQVDEIDPTTRWVYAVGAVLALLVGLAISIGLSAVQQTSRGSTTVVVARREVPDRTLFTGGNLEELLATRTLPTDAVPEGALTRPGEAIGKATVTRLATGEVVLGTPDRLASGEGATARAAAAIPPDKIALAIPANESLSVAGALQPGDRVDVFATWTRRAGQPVTQNIFQDVRVFAVGPWQGELRQRVTATVGSGSASTITLLLDPAEAAVLEYLLRTGGHIAIALRRFDQAGVWPNPPVTDDVLTRRFLGGDDGRPSTSGLGLGE
jgi:pilus assembly protein CpaB